MRLAVTSDLHGHLPEIEPVDVMCIGGDITPDCYARDAEAQWSWFNTTFMTWVDALPCQKVLLVAGNHDYCFEAYKPASMGKLIYLENSGVELFGYSFWGTPNVPRPFHNFAFCQHHEQLVETFARIPDRLDFLICHGAPFGVNGCGVWRKGLKDLGCFELTEALMKKHISYIFCGHIHRGNHHAGLWRGKRIMNVSFCGDRKEPRYPVVYVTR